VRVQLILVAGAILVAGSACDAFHQAMAQPGPARWGLAPDTEIDPDTTEFVAMVTEAACASGQSSEGRVVGPDVSYTEDAVTVTFAVRPLSGAQECPGNPATRVAVRLDEPLGARVLLDGGSDPPLEPPVCANPEFCE
jgi:hypothetical protein